MREMQIGALIVSLERTLSAENAELQQHLRQALDRGESIISFQTDKWGRAPAATREAIRPAVSRPIHRCRRFRGIAPAGHLWRSFGKRIHPRDDRLRRGFLRLRQ